MSEDKDLLTRISQLAGHINLHKGRGPSVLEDKNSSQQVPHSHGQRPWASSRGHPSDRRGYRGTRSSAGFAHRNRSLILNQNGENTGRNGAPDASVLSHPDHDYPLRNQEDNKVATHGNAWVSKRDRHMQLINSSIYDQKTSMRNKAIEQTRQQRKLRKEAREKQKINKHLQLYATESALIPHVLVIGGLRFQVCNGGSKLARDKNSEPSHHTPKMTLVGGVKFYRSRNGNLYRSGLVEGRRIQQLKRQINEPCKRFTTTGQCTSGPRCRYVHDPSKVAICREFLKSGDCPQGALCDLSHNATYERVPACLHFLRGKCTKTTCRYPHVRVNPASQVCRAFSTLGYCSKGLSCENRHVLECPDYSSSGICREPNCRLPHVDRAGQLRQKANVSQRESNSDAPSENSDVTSEEENTPEVNSEEDVDSDGLEEEMMLEPELGSEHGLSQQHDFVPV